MLFKSSKNYYLAKLQNMLLVKTIRRDSSDYNSSFIFTVTPFLFPHTVSRLVCANTNWL